MLLELTAANARSRVWKLIDPIAVTELGMIFETFNGKSLQSMWSVYPIQKYFTPSVQFFGMPESAAVSIAVAALETALSASLAALEAAVAAALAALWAWVAAVETTPGMALGFDGTDRATPREVILVKSNCKLVRIVRSRKERRYYEDGDKPAVLVAWLAYNIKTECHTKNASNRKRNQGPP
jgi:hypothetical protein